MKPLLHIYRCLYVRSLVIYTLSGGLREVGDRGVSLRAWKLSIITFFLQYSLNFCKYIHNVTEIHCSLISLVPTIVLKYEGKERGGGGILIVRPGCQFFLVRHCIYALSLSLSVSLSTLFIRYYVLITWLPHRVSLFLSLLPPPPPPPLVVSWNYISIGYRCAVYIYRQKPTRIWTRIVVLIETYVCTYKLKRETYILNRIFLSETSLNVGLKSYADILCLCV